jgi:hypothetical protein
VKTFDRLYREHADPWDGRGPFYGIPRIGVAPSAVERRYRGAAREPLQPCAAETEEMLGALLPAPTERDAQRRLAELPGDGLASDEFILDFEAALAIHALLSRPEDFEVVWTGLAASAYPRACSVALGFEPIRLFVDRLSAVADAFFFPVTGAADGDGRRLRDHYERLNHNGLFDTVVTADEFLHAYCRCAGMDAQDFRIVEVRLAWPARLASRGPA